LITLGIIGIVAALTIPTLMNKSQKQQTVTALKKSYSTFSQVIERSSVDNGDMESWDFSLNTADFLDKYIVPYLSISKNCIGKTNDCWVTDTWLNGDGAYSPASGESFITSDGTGYLFYKGTYSGGKGFFDLVIDLNGFKKPNMSGKDVFNARLIPEYNGRSATNIVFVGTGDSRSNLTSTSNYGCNKKASTAPGHVCGALIQLDGWQIKDDYPW
ncbi:type II secretion system protein, partial [bacterium]|nr:type II secretion system protein [bacterium]